MSKHNNNLGLSAEKRCKCGRYITLGELKAGIGTINYVCPDCFHHQHSKPISRENYYKQFNIILN